MLKFGSLYKRSQPWELTNRWTKNKRFATKA
jgi:hypothetical protein